jgi:hypothetical protein
MKTPKWLTKAFELADTAMYKMSIAHRATHGDPVAVEAHANGTPKDVFRKQEAARIKAAMQARLKRAR